MSLLARVEKLERERSGGGGPDHIIMYPHVAGQDEAAERAAAVAHYRATHATKPDDVFGFIVMHPYGPGQAQ